MRNIMAIWRRELGALLVSPAAYVAWVVFLALTGGGFMVAVLRHANTEQPLVMQFLAATVIWMTLLIPLVCMRLFAEARRSGSLESLLTAPVTEWEAVLGKYAGAYSFIVLVVACAFAYPFILALLGPGPGAVDPGALAGGGLLLLVLAALCTAIGLLCSLLTQSVIAAAILGLAGVWLVMLMGWIATTLPLGLSEAWSALSAMEQLERFGRGLVDTRPVLIALTLTAWILFVAVRVLESRRWR
jgi:ABC-2 type transport system permease protein